MIEAKRAEGVSNATVNRTMEVVRAILRKATNEWAWIDRAPAVRMLPEPRRRIRWLTQEEAERLIAELPEHLAEMVRRYAHLAADQLAEYADRLARPRAFGGTILAHGRRRKESKEL